MTKTRISLNKIAAKDNLKLIKGEGYFYWIGLNDDMGYWCASLFTTSVPVCKFSQMPFERWLNELEEVKKSIKEEIIVIIQFSEGYKTESSYYRENFNINELIQYWKKI